MLEEGGSILEEETKRNTEESQAAPGKQTRTEESQPSLCESAQHGALFESLLLPFVSLT